jgi:predicted small secreted protein
MKKLLVGILPLLFGMVILLAGCENQGPAEKAGENIDNAARKVKDAVTPAGPMEKAGEKVDKAVNP